jgi:uncharacterized protein YndB with AHSA1/START domain
MATVDIEMAASPDQVFSVLADGWTYSNWVVGTSHMRAVEANWPDVGSRLFHASGAWPAVVRDETSVEAMDRDRRLILTARGWPLGEARIEIRLRSNGTGTTVTLIETPTAGPGKWLHNPISEALLVRRNVEALARLAALVERRTVATD